jgi:hypothetical protein
MSSLTKMRKSVTFAEDTMFEPSRPQALYHRRNSHYTRGEHGRPADDDWEDTSFMTNLTYQLNHHKVLQTFTVVDLQHAQALKIALNDQMRSQSNMDYLFAGDMPAVQNHPAHKYLMAELEKSVLAQETNGAQNFVQGIDYADGLILWKEKGSGDYLGVQWITDTYTNGQACDMVEDMKRAIAQGNGGCKRSLVLSRLRSDLETLKMCDV